MALKWILAFAILLVVVRARFSESGAPQAFSFSASPEAVALQQSMYGFEELETGKTHHFERWIYDEQSKIIQYHNSTIRLRSTFHNLNKKKRVVRIHCHKSTPSITIHTTQRLNISNGDLVYFGHHWNSSCHHHHKHGKNATNLFEVTDLEISPTTFRATIRPAKPEEVFEHAKIKTYYEHLNTDHSRVMSGLSEYDYSEEEDSDIYNFRKENLSPEGVTFVTALHRYEHQQRYKFKKRFSFGSVFRSIGSAISSGASAVGSAISSGARAVGSAVSSVANTVVKGLTAAASDVWNALKSIGSFSVSKTVSTSITLASSSQSFLSGLITVSSSVTISPSFTLNIDVQTFALKSASIAVVGSCTGSIGAKFAAQKSVSKTVNLLNVNSPPVDIPTPVPGLFVTVQATGSLTAEFDASFSVTADLGSFTATGSVGATFSWGSSSGWSTTPQHSFSMTLAPPQITDVSASLSFTLTPSISLQLGVSGADIITVSGGPTLGVPLTVALKADLLNKCNLELVATWALTVGITVQLEVFDKTLLNSQLLNKQLASGSILDRCLLATSASQVVNNVNNAAQNVANNVNNAIANQLRNFRF